MQGWGLQARPSSTVPSHTSSSGWQLRLRTCTPPPHSWLHTDQRPQPAQPSAGRDKKRRYIEQGWNWCNWWNYSDLVKTNLGKSWYPCFICTKLLLQKHDSTSTPSVNFIYKNRKQVLFVFVTENEQGRVFVSRNEHSGRYSIWNGDCLLLTTWCEPR